MKKLFLFFASTFIMVAVCAQQGIPTSNTADVAPSSMSNSSYSAKALWDVQLSFDASTPANGTIGLAGVAFINGQFWASQWASDTIVRYTSAGGFVDKIVIPEMAGARSMTTNGTSLYVGTASNTIRIINPLTQLEIGTITSAAPVASRFLTYDPTLDGGNGGFWTGNFNTDIYAISMTGAVLSTIAQATHTLAGGMYGAAYDGSTAGGPYLWVFHQGPPQNAQLVALQLPSGTPTVMSRDVISDLVPLHGLSSGLAGGAFFTNSLIPGQSSIIVLTQGSPFNTITAYDTEYSDNYDIEVTAVRSIEGYTQIPKTQVFNESYELSYGNASTQSVDTIYGTFEYYFDGSLIATETQTATNIPTGGSGTFTSSPFSMITGVGQYDVKAYAYPNAAITDTDHANDTLYYNFAVTDSVYARDNGISTGTGYTVSITDSAYIMSVFELFQPDSLLGIIIELEPSSVPDMQETFALAYHFDGTSPTSEIARGIATVMNTGQNEYYLQFTDAVPLSSGEYALGCFEPLNFGMGLLQSNNVYTPGTNFFFTAGSGWSSSGIQTARAIRPVLAAFEDNSGIQQLKHTDFSMYPVPSQDYLWIKFNETVFENTVIYITDMNGRVIKQTEVELNQTNVRIDLHDIQSGTYMVRTVAGNKTAVQKFIKL